MHVQKLEMKVVGIVVFVLLILYKRSNADMCNLSNFGKKAFYYHRVMSYPQSEIWLWIKDLFTLIRENYYQELCHCGRL